MENNSKYFIFDLETTSLDIDTAKIVEIAYLIVKNGNIIKQVDEIIKPEGYIIPVRSIEIHKITNEIAREKGKDKKEVLNILLKDIEDIKYVVGHNIKRYDMLVLKNNLKEIGLDINWNKYSIEDTIEAQRIKLGDMYRHLFGEELENAHNALSDVIGTYKCYRKIKEEGIDMSKEEIYINKDNNIIKFGKYVNYRYCEILKDKNYCEWLINQNNSKELLILKTYIMDKYMKMKFIDKENIHIRDIVDIIKFSKEINKIIKKIKIETYKYKSNNVINKSKNVVNEIYYGMIDYMIRYMIMKGINKKIYEYGYSEKDEEERKYINLEATKMDIINLVHRKYNKKVNNSNIIDEGCMKLIKEIVGYILFEGNQIENVYIDKKIKGRQIYSDSYIIKGNDIMCINKNGKKINNEMFLDIIIYCILIDKKYDNIMIYDINHNELHRIDGNIEYGNSIKIIENIIR
jgi:DNA polymerase-3 subunit epsilon